MNEAIEKNKLKVQNLKADVVTKSNNKRISKNDKNNSIDVEIESNVISCRECSSKFDIKTSKGWLACENCINWFCSRLIASKNLKMINAHIVKTFILIIYFIKKSTTFLYVTNKINFV